MANVTTVDQADCADCRAVRPGVFTRYRELLLSKETIIACVNGGLLLAGFLAGLGGLPDLSRWLYFASAVIGGMPLFALAARNVFVHHDITAGVMSSVAMLAAIAVGEYSAAALVVFMFAIGDWLENLTIARANNALKGLAQLVPAMVTVRQGSAERQIPIEQVRKGDVVLVRSGERVGVDGRVLQGSASVTQAAITGESMPVEKRAGDDVFAGTLNEVGALEVETTRTGSETTLGHIVQLVKDAQVAQAPVQRVANQYARVLVPVTFAIAAAVYLLSGDILRSITVLVVVCPCALVLATPTAVMAAAGNAARRGMLVKTGAALEQIGQVNVVALDKTGTLTRGQPVVQTILTLNGMGEQQILALAAATEQYSEHPIGRSIVRAARERQVPVGQATDFVTLPGYGVTAQVDRYDVMIGNRSLLAARGVTWPGNADRPLQSFEQEGYTVIPVAVNGQVAGLVTLADTPREEAKATVADLKRLGVEVVMLTGDNRITAERIAAYLGIERVYAQVLPQDKLRIIRDLQAGGKKVAFVGDGVNDAPALAAADIGVAMGLIGTDVAVETAGIGLMADDLARLPQLIDLSRRTLRVIRQNVIFSMSMNVLSVVLGGVGIIGPVAGALMHELSALPVLANAARLIQGAGPLRR
ncbi:MAG: cation-translocating P-type ATPase [Chloroflexi bacterium]|nr:cation-translocating P-type ATPase [Chloroflexota bacterium]